MSKEVLYEVNLESPDYCVSFYAPEGLSSSEILEKAINEMIKNTCIWNYKVRP